MTDKCVSLLNGPRFAERFLLGDTGGALEGISVKVKTEIGGILKTFTKKNGVNEYSQKSNLNLIFFCEEMDQNRFHKD